MEMSGTKANKERCVYLLIYFMFWLCNIYFTPLSILLSVIDSLFLLSFLSAHPSFLLLHPFSHSSSLFIASPFLPSSLQPFQPFFLPLHLFTHPLHPLCSNPFVHLSTELVLLIPCSSTLLVPLFCLLCLDLLPLILPFTEWISLTLLSVLYPFTYPLVLLCFPSLLSFPIT